MDADWFKNRQKTQGVTVHDLGEALGRDRTIVSRFYSGRQKMNVSDAVVFAELLDVTMDEVLERAGIRINPTVKRKPPGFSEGDVVMLVPDAKSSSAEQVIATVIGKESPGVDVWQVNSQSLVLAGYLPGDFMLVDSHKADRCVAGDVVIAQVYDGQSGTAKTVLRKWHPPVLVAASVDPKDEKVHFVDGHNVAIRGKVIASWRA